MRTRTITLSSGTTLTVSATLTLVNSSTGATTLNTGTLEAQGNVTVGDTFNGSATLRLTGSGNQSFDLSGATNLLDLDVQVNKSAGQVDLASDFTADAANQATTSV